MKLVTSVEISYFEQAVVVDEAKLGKVFTMYFYIYWPLLFCQYQFSTEVPFCQIQVKYFVFRF